MVTEIRCNGVAMETSAYSISGNTITLVNAPAGENVYTFVSDTVEYVMNICVYNVAISSKAEFLAWRDVDSWKYAILTADIDLENATLSAAGAGAVRGILDGRGHKISNFTVTTGLVNTIQVAGGFKNVSFINVTQDCSSLAAPIKYGFLTQTTSGTIENVFIQGTIINVAAGANHWGILVYNSQATAVIKNVVLDVVSDCVGANLTMNVTTFTEIDNVHLNFRSTDATYQGKVVITDATVTNSAAYASDAQLANADFSLFTGIWTVEEGMLPYMTAESTED